jgi:hypothetical protein
MDQSEIQISRVNSIYKLLSGTRFPLNSEKALQEAIFIKLKHDFINLQREYVLDEHNRPDFYVAGVVIEIKISGSAKDIYRQCERYCQFPDVHSLILVTNRSMGFPKEINGKPCYVLNLGKAWL